MTLSLVVAIHSRLAGLVMRLDDAGFVRLADVLDVVRRGAQRLRERLLNTEMVS